MAKDELKETLLSFRELAVTVIAAIDEQLGDEAPDTDAVEEVDGDAAPTFEAFKDKCNAFKKEESNDELKNVLHVVGETDLKTQVGRMMSAVEEQFWLPVMNVCDDWNLITPENLFEIISDMKKKDRRLLLDDFGIGKAKEIKDMDDPAKILKLYVAVTQDLD